MKTARSYTDYFQLRPVTTAKVSEISEATSASPTAVEDRINFHIGNPVQDNRLINLYFQLVTGLSKTDKPDEQHPDWTAQHKNLLELIHAAIEKSVPYLPRGGYLRASPGEMIEFIKTWLTEKQPEPLQYDFGSETGIRECIIVSGGQLEYLRILFHSLAHYLVHLPACICSYKLEIPLSLTKFTGLDFKHIAGDGANLVTAIREHFREELEKPVFLILGDLVSEITRRELRNLSLQFPIFIIEANNAPNHFSLDREAKMRNHVLRILSSAVFLPGQNELPVSVITGNADYLRILENVHFELKGTPPAAEVELFNYLVTNNVPESGNDDLPVFYQETDKSAERFMRTDFAAETIEHITTAYQKKQTRYQEISENYTGRVMEISTSSLAKFRHSLHSEAPFDRFSPAQLTERIVANPAHKEHLADLQKSLLSAFRSHHPEYDYQNIHLVSGSSRTALSLLGFHCGISDVIAPDLSWTYHHCFPRVHSVSLTDNMELNTGQIISLASQLRLDTQVQNIAVVLNNPHNASGQIFDRSDLIELLKTLLSQKIFIIDDLSYENVMPSENLTQISTLKQLSNELVKTGYLSAEERDYLITVHSFSKTDCFAGGRLAVAEINHPQLAVRFKDINSMIHPNVMASLLAYLFYRNPPDKIGVFWRLRNQILNERMQALEQEAENLPPERNPYQITLRRPKGSMYPHLIVENLPQGISLDWLASGLARRGIGLIPFTTFSSTTEGFELARKTFRLTLGGPAGKEELLRKTRRVLIDLNRIIAEESSHYNLNTIPLKTDIKSTDKYFPAAQQIWTELEDLIFAGLQDYMQKELKEALPELSFDFSQEKFFKEFITDRLRMLHDRYRDIIDHHTNILFELNSGNSEKIIHLLDKEFYKENLQERSNRFRHRLFDRTVHPTQNYSIKVASAFDKIITTRMNSNRWQQSQVRTLSIELIKEFLGINVPVRAVEEGQELVLDLKSVILAEEFIRWRSKKEIELLLSFWGDWDGSTRPSGQGHLLVAAVILENVQQLARILKLIHRMDRTIELPGELLHEVQSLDRNIANFWQLLQNINALTNQLEQRYRSVLPVNIVPSRARKLATKLKIGRDPLKVLWQHNDRLEKRMRDLRVERKNSLEYYFKLNKSLRKALHNLLPHFKSLLQNREFAILAATYRSPLRRFNLTPRIHQNMITSVDQFAIDTTVHNMLEINTIAGQFGIPGIIQALQISMSNKPEALIALDRKIRSQRENILREHRNLDLPNIWLIPLFEDTDTVRDIEAYYNRLWEYAIQSRRIDQEPAQRFSEMVCEVFIAGSDLSQQVSQSQAAILYKEAKLKTVKWLAEKGLIEDVRIKFGSGEPMQRQGGYYRTPLPKTFLKSRNIQQRMNAQLSQAAQKSIEYAKSPLRGILSDGDLRTLQSNVFEKLKCISTPERAQVFYHIYQAQKYYSDELTRISEPFRDTRLYFQERGFQELERISYGRRDPIYLEFTDLVSQNFRQILYGSDEDIVGIHVISYFISRTTPILRDRPTVRPTRDISSDRGQQIIQRIAQTLPLSRHGTLLRAIGHNRAQSMILGVNQLTTGLFRALDEFSTKYSSLHDPVSLLSDRILPNLPVYEILNSLRLYHEPDAKYLYHMENAFPAGNSAFLLLREDLDSLKKYLVLFQKEFLRRHGLNINDFFDRNRFKPDLLPMLAPESAVLLQPDIFNTSLDELEQLTGTKTDQNWKSQIADQLIIPVYIRKWREQIWQLIGNPIFTQVSSFVELATALHTLTAGKSIKDINYPISPARVFRLGSNITQLLQGVGDDSMRQFLFSVVQFLTQLPATTEQLPINILRALEDVETIIKIEDQALGKKEQDLFRFYFLQIARLAGENG